MKIRKIKLGNINDFEETKRKFVEVIIKELYNNKINDCDYDTLETRIVFLKEIMEQENWDYVLGEAYSMFERDNYKIYEAKSGIVWLVISNEYMNCKSDIYITKKELEALGAK